MRDGGGLPHVRPGEGRSRPGLPLHGPVLRGTGPPPPRRRGPGGGRLRAEVNGVPLLDSAPPTDTMIRPPASVLERFHARDWAEARTPGMNSGVWGSPRLNIRHARVGDVPAICELIRTFADRKLMIRRSLGELYEAIREFLVALDDDGKIIGCAALHVFWDDLAELKCLAVSQDAQEPRGWPEAGGRPLGLRAGAGEEIASVFTLTLRPRFLRAVRLPPDPRSPELPHKIWERVRPLPPLPQLQRGRPHPRLPRNPGDGDRGGAGGPGRLNAARRLDPCPDRPSGPIASPRGNDEPGRSGDPPGRPEPVRRRAIATRRRPRRGRQRAWPPAIDRRSSWLDEIQRLSAEEGDAGLVRPIPWAEVKECTRREAADRG